MISHCEQYNCYHHATQTLAAIPMRLLKSIKSGLLPDTSKHDFNLETFCQLPAIRSLVDHERNRRTHQCSIISLVLIISARKPDADHHPSRL